MQIMPWARIWQRPHRWLCAYPQVETASAFCPGTVTFSVNRRNSADYRPIFPLTRPAVLSDVAPKEAPEYRHTPNLACGGEAVYPKRAHFVSAYRTNTGDGRAYAKLCEGKATAPPHVLFDIDWYAPK